MHKIEILVANRTTEVSESTDYPITFQSSNFLFQPNDKVVANPQMILH
jgi:hypothetical protein